VGWDDGVHAGCPCIAWNKILTIKLLVLCIETQVVAILDFVV
jgi:hypothetical protein